MKERRTVRLLLLDADHRILLVKIGNDPVTDMSGESFPDRWITTGGKIEEGESVAEAAAREGLEETGIEGLAVGPAVWLNDHQLVLDGEPTQFRETFVVVHAPAASIHDQGWTEYERGVFLELRWWTLDELRTTQDLVYPVWLAEYLPDIIAGKYPAVPLRIEKGRDHKTV